MDSSTVNLAVVRAQTCEFPSQPAIAKSQKKRRLSDEMPSAQPSPINKYIKISNKEEKKREMRDMAYDFAQHLPQGNNAGKDWDLDPGRFHFSTRMLGSLEIITGMI
jgi:hypothetical protein